VQQQIAGNFEEEIPKKEDSGGESKLLAGNGQFLVHRQSRKADVDAVNERDDVEKEEKGKKSDLQFPDGSGLDEHCRGVCSVNHRYLRLRLPSSCERTCR